MNQTKEESSNRETIQQMHTAAEKSSSTNMYPWMTHVVPGHSGHLIRPSKDPPRPVTDFQRGPSDYPCMDRMRPRHVHLQGSEPRNNYMLPIMPGLVGGQVPDPKITTKSNIPSLDIRTTMSQAQAYSRYVQQHNDMIQMQQALRRNAMHEALLKRERNMKPSQDCSPANNNKLHARNERVTDKTMPSVYNGVPKDPYSHSGTITHEGTVSKSNSSSSTLSPRTHRPSVSSDVSVQNSVSPVSHKSHTESSMETYSPPLDLSFNKKRPAPKATGDQPLDLSVKRRRKEKEDSDDDVILVGVQTVQHHPQPSTVSSKHYKSGLQRYSTPAPTSVISNDPSSTAFDSYINKKEYMGYIPRPQTNVTNTAFPAAQEPSRQTHVPYFRIDTHSNAQKSEQMAQHESRMDAPHMKSTYHHVVPHAWGSSTKCSTSDISHMPTSTVSMASKTYERPAYSQQQVHRSRSPNANIVHHNLERPPTLAHIEKIPNIYSTENQMIFKENPHSKPQSQGPYQTKVQHPQHGLPVYPNQCRDHAPQHSPANKQENNSKSGSEHQGFIMYKQPKEYMTQMCSNSSGLSRHVSLDKIELEKGPYKSERDYQRNEKPSFSKGMYVPKDERICSKSNNYMPSCEQYKLAGPDMEGRKYYTQKPSGCSSGTDQKPSSECLMTPIRSTTLPPEQKQDLFNSVPSVPKHIASVQGSAVYPPPKPEPGKGAILQRETELPYSDQVMRQSLDIKSFDKVGICQTRPIDRIPEGHQQTDHDVKQYTQLQTRIYNEQSSVKKTKTEPVLKSEPKSSVSVQKRDIQCTSKDTKTSQVPEHLPQVSANPNMVSKTESKFHTNPAPKLIPVANVHPILKTNTEANPKDENSKEKVEIIPKKEEANLELSTSVMEVFRQTLDATPQKIQITPNPLFSSHQDEFVRFLSRTKTDQKMLQKLNKKQISKLLEKHGLTNFEGNDAYKTPESSNDLGANAICGTTSECELERVRRNLALHFTTPKGRHKLLAKQSADVVDDVPLSSATEVLPILQDKTLLATKELETTTIETRDDADLQEAVLTQDSTQTKNVDVSTTQPNSSEQKVIKRRKRKPKDPERAKTPRKTKVPGVRRKKSSQEKSEKLTAKERRKNYYTRKKPNDEGKSSPHKRTWRKDGRPKLASRLRRALRSSRSSSKYDKNAAYEAELRKEEERRMLRRVRRRGRSEPENGLALEDVPESDDTLVSDVISTKDRASVVTTPSNFDHYLFDEPTDSVDTLFKPTPFAHVRSSSAEGLNDKSLAPAPGKTTQREKRKPKKMLKEKTSKRGPRVKKTLTKRRQKLTRPPEVAYEGVSPEDIFPNTVVMTQTILPLKPAPPVAKTKVKRYPMQRVRRRHKREPRSYLKSEPSLDKNDKKRLFVCRETGETTLHKAARKGYVEVALHCLDSGELDVNVRDNAGYTPLHESCVSGNLPIAKALIDRGADPNIKALDGTRPLHDAVDNNHLEHARLLLSHGADPTIANYAGRTPLKMARSTNMKNFLNDYFADMRDDSGDWEVPAFVGKQGRELGYDILDGAPSDNEKEADSDIFFDMSSEVHPASICLQMEKDSGYRNYHLVSEIAQMLGVDNTDDFLLLNGDLRFREIARDDLVKRLESDDPLMISGDAITKVKDIGDDVISIVEINDTLCHLLEVSRDRVSASDLALEQWFLGPLGFSSRVNKSRNAADALAKGVFSTVGGSEANSKPTIGSTRKNSKQQIPSPAKSAAEKCPTNSSNSSVKYAACTTKNAALLNKTGNPQRVIDTRPQNVVDTRPQKVVCTPTEADISSRKNKQNRGTAKDKPNATGIRKSKSCTSLKNMLPVCSRSDNLSRCGSSPNVHSNIALKSTQSSVQKPGCSDVGNMAPVKPGNPSVKRDDKPKVITVALKSTQSSVQKPGCSDVGNMAPVKPGNPSVRRDDKSKVNQTVTQPEYQNPKHQHVDKSLEITNKIKVQKMPKTSDPSKVKKSRPATSRKGAVVRNDKMSSPADTRRPSDHVVVVKKSQLAPVEAGVAMIEPALPVLEEHTKSQQAPASEESSVEEEREMPELTLCAY